MRGLPRPAVLAAHVSIAGCPCQHCWLALRMLGSVALVALQAPLPCLMCGPPPLLPCLPLIWRIHAPAHVCASWSLVLTTFVAPRQCCFLCGGGAVGGVGAFVNAVRYDEKAAARAERLQRKLLPELDVRPDDELLQCPLCTQSPLLDLHEPLPRALMVHGPTLLFAHNRRVFLHVLLTKLPVIS